MQPHDHELPENHDALLALAADCVVVAAAPIEPHRALPAQRTLAISDETLALVGDPSVGLRTHGR